MAPTLYVVYASPPVRAVLMIAKAIGLSLTEKEIDIFAGDHLNFEYLKLNPQHTVPTLVDNDGFAIWDSHAIITYLVSKYAKDDSLYPKDLKKRAIVDQRLHFDSGVLFPRLFKVSRPIIFEGKTTVDQKDKDKVLEAYEFLNTFLNGHQWVAGDFISVADFSLVTTISTVNILIPLDSQKHPNIVAWLKRMETRPEYSVNVIGIERITDMVNSKLSNA